MSWLSHFPVTLVVLVICLGAARAGTGLAKAPANFQGVSAYVPPPLNSKEQPLDFLDKQYKRLDDIKCQLKTADEILGGMEALLSHLFKAVDELELTVIPGLLTELTNQDARLHDIDTHLSTFNSDTHNVERDLAEIVILNSNNTDNAFSSVHDNIAPLISVDTRQDGLIAELTANVDDLKSKLFQVFGNELALFDASVAEFGAQLEGIRACESKRLCETGEVALEAGETRAEYLFQNKFSKTPQVFYQLAGYSFLLNTRDPPSPSYGTFLPWKEPNVFGVFVSANPSRTGVTFQKSNLAFGDTANKKVVVNFQACDILTIY